MISSVKNADVLVDVKDLAVYFHIEQGIVKAVDGVNFQIERGKSLGIVGESGCGKTITALSLMLLHPQPEGQIERGYERIDERLRNLGAKIERSD